jgi:tRNA nucleotidyltransferase (CCA-adding enzyme)
MPDYIYLLENRLSPSQQSTLQAIREAARDSGMTVFLTGGAVRDLTSGSPVRDIDVSVQGNALELKDKLVQAGAVIWGEHLPSQTLFARFPGSVRVEVSSTRREEFPKPGKPVYHPGSILEDLRRRDFTANAMALSLNDGSYGLLMDPLNGVADLEARLLRLVSNYGFLEDPIRLVRAARLRARLGWELEDKTKVRFDNAREEGVISQISSYQQGYEVEEVLHEEDGLKILKALEADGWMKSLYPAWTSEKVDASALESLREVLVQLQMQGVNPDPSAAQAQVLTAKLGSKDLAGLKKLFVRQGFVREWETQEERSREIGKRLTGKEASTPSATWKLLTSADPEAVLWLGLTGKSLPVQAKFNDFFTVWPEARQKIPYSIMQEMRITPELSGYQDLLRSIFFELIDGRLTSEEEIRQFLEPYSPPAPPPPVTIRRTRAKKSAEKNREAREDVDDEAAEGRGELDDDADEE